MNKIKSITLILAVITTTVLFAACAGTTQSKQPKSTLNIEAAIIYKIDGVKPLARETFYLLDKSAEEILKSANLRPDLTRFDKQIDRANMREALGKQDYLQLLALAHIIPEDNSTYLLEVDKEIQKHIVKSVTTDLQGKAQFEGIEPKTYFIYGVAETRSGKAIWNLPIDIKSEQQSIILDQNNTFVIN